MTSGEEETFRNFTAQQAREYNASRGHAYPSGLYEHVLAYHKANGGKAKLALDLGCGPGNATRDLVAYFDRIIGLDGSPEMVNTAREMIPDSWKDKLSFENVLSEKIHETPGIEENTVDVVTVATAVHWFDLPKFYASALRVLRPGGVIAIWSYGRPRLGSETSHATEINNILEEFMKELGPYRQERSHVAEDMYANLLLPWTLNPTVAGYDETSYERTIFSTANGNQIAPSTQYTIDQAERMYGSGSPIVRWREQHPDLANTDKDIVKIYFNKMREIMGDQDTLEADMQFVLILWRKLP